MSEDTMTPLKTLPKKEAFNLLALTLILHPIFSTLLLLIALSQLGITKFDALGISKLFLLGGAAFLSAYMIYRIAIDRLSVQGAVGMGASSLFGGLATFLVGFSFFLSTAPGLMLPGVEEARLQKFFDELVIYTDGRNADTGQAARLVPVLETISDDLNEKATCEIENSCISGNGRGGYGPIAKSFEQLGARAAAIGEKAAEGLKAREGTQLNLSNHIEDLEKVLADEGLSIWDRRAELRRQYSHFGYHFNRLNEAMPIALIEGYKLELEKGVNLKGNRRESRTINDILATHAEAMSSVMESIEDGVSVRPAFPEKSGVIDTFAYAGKYAPLVLLTFMIDIIFPLLAWYATLADLKRRIRDHESRENESREKESAA